MVWYRFLSEWNFDQTSLDMMLQLNHASRCKSELMVKFDHQCTITASFLGGSQINVTMTLLKRAQDLAEI